MKLKFSIVIICLIILNNVALTQNMAAGFKMLDNAQYDQAQTFFTNILSESPENKTAAICLGRAIGLGGDATKASAMFSRLLERHPEDMEITINLAESSLWANDYKSAIKLYQELKLRDSNSVSILLGLSNAYAADTQYTLAYTEVSKLNKLHPENNQILGSYKSITLAYAHQLKQANHLQKSKLILDNYRAAYPQDASGLKSSAYLYMALKDIQASGLLFESLLQLNTHNDQALLGLASISLFSKDFNQAISYCLHNDVIAASTIDNAVRSQQLDILYGAYLESGKLNLALETLEQLKNFISKNVYYEKLIYIDLQKENYADIPQYLQSIQDEEDSLRMTLNFYIHQEEYKNARVILDKMSPTQRSDKQVNHLAERLSAEESSHLSTTIDHTEDNGGYASSILSAHYTGANATTVRPMINIMTYQLKQAEKNITFRRHQLNAGLLIRLNNKHTTGISFGLQSEKYNQLDSDNQLILNLSHLWSISKRQFFKINFESGQLPVNYELIREQVNQDILQLEHHIIGRSGIGSYTSLTVNKLSDNNLGINFVNSLYYNLSSSPLIQIGLNTNVQSYKHAAENYFSPELLYTISSFAKISNEYIPNKTWAYDVTISLGKQSSPNKSMNQITYNLSTQIGYHFAPNIALSMYGQYSKSDGANHIDFMRYQVGLRLSHTLSK